MILEPGEAPPIHTHDDAEQVFYILEGEGVLGVGPGGRREAPAGRRRLRPDAAGRAATRCAASVPSRFVYLSIDCFAAGPIRPSRPGTATSAQMCADHGWEFDAVKLGPVDGHARASESAARTRA